MERNRFYPDATFVPLRPDPLTPYSLGEPQRPPERLGTAAWIKYFDRHWQQEGLTQSWYALKTQSSKRVGFILSQQMELLKDPADKAALLDWTQKTKRDLEGFKLEFLSNEVVYPRKYFRDPNDRTRLVDPFYGSKDIEELVSEEERKGSVKRSVSRAKKFLLSAPDRSMAVITSPLGPTGFKTDDGLAIDYPDSYFFIMQGEGQEVMNYTLKTNFKLPQCREAIEKLTGQKLTFNSSVQDYVEAIATFKPGEKNIYSVQDIVSTLRNVQPQHAFVDEQNSLITTWDMVARAIDQKEELYNFEEKTVRAIADFVIFAKEGNHTKEELQKAIAATILRMSDLFFRPDEQKVMQPSIWYELCSNPLSFGKVLEKAAERRGCSGGGDSVAVSSLVTRAGSLGEDQYGARAFNCPECGKMNLRPQGELLSACQHCGSKAVAC